MWDTVLPPGSPRPPEREVQSRIGKPRSLCEGKALSSLCRADARGSRGEAVAAGCSRGGEALGLGLAGWMDSREERARQRQGHQGRAVRLREPGAPWAPPPLPIQRPLQKCGSSNGPSGIGWKGGMRRQRGSGQDELWPCRALCGRAVAQVPCRLTQRQGHSGELEGVPRVPACRAPLLGGVGTRWYTLSASPHPRCSPLPGGLPLRWLRRILRRPQHHPCAGEWQPGQGLWSDGPELKAQPQPPPSSTCPRWASQAVPIKWERS